MKLNTGQVIFMRTLHADYELLELIEMHVDF